jgi:hypothetical protein
MSPGAILVGAGAVLLAPLVLPAAASALRSVTKFGIKTAMIGYDKGKEVVSGGKDAVAGMTGSISDITSEAKAEVFGPAKKQPKKTPAAS